VHEIGNDGYATLQINSGDAYPYLIMTRNNESVRLTDDEARDLAETILAEMED
jgi:hypothetical protein